MKLVDTDALLQVLLKDRWSRDSHFALISALINRPYCMTEINIPHEMANEAAIHSIMNIFGHKNIIFWHKSYKNDRSFDVTFENKENDRIYLDVCRDHISVYIFSVQESLHERYEKRIKMIMELLCPDDREFVRVGWNCFLHGNPHGSTHLTIKLPKNVETAVPLNNYALNTQMEIAKLEETLMKANYYGQLIVLEGEPGTGKSYYVRRLVSRLYQEQRIREIYYYLGEGIRDMDVEHCLYPNLLIFEDSDYILRRDVHRHSDVSKILNFSSGFVDTKALFIFTTNLEVGEMDPAFMRDGRLMARIKFGTFSRIEAQNWLAARNCEIELEDGKYTLANLYAKLKHFNKISYTPESVTIGFRK